MLRVTSRDVPQPYAQNLEKLVVPTPQRIVDAALRAMGRVHPVDNALDALGAR